jgi:hypothetical protein
MAYFALHIQRQRAEIHACARLKKNSTPFGLSKKKISRQSVGSVRPVSGRVGHLVDVWRTGWVSHEIIDGLVHDGVNFSIGDGPARKASVARRRGRSSPVVHGGQVPFVVKRQARGRGVEKWSGARLVGVHFLAGKLFLYYNRSKFFIFTP